MAKLGPEEDQRARALIIDAYSAQHDLPHALDETARALKDFPGNRGFRITQALLAGENNQPDAAVKLLQPMLQNAHGDMEIYMNLAQVYQGSRRYDDAENALRSAEKLVQQPAERESVGFLFGSLYESQKKYDQAEEAFKGVLGVNPRNASVLNYYGYMLADRGVRLDEAVSLVQKALAEEPTNAAYLDSLGWAYFKQGRLPDAESYIRKAILRNPHNPTLRSHLGDVLARSGKTDLAVAEWQRSVAEWDRVAPAEFEADKVAELQQKISSARKAIAQKRG
jgi:tetratricopeptide (TPR) repeat protein